MLEHTLALFDLFIKNSDSFGSPSPGPLGSTQQYHSSDENVSAIYLNGISLDSPLILFFIPRMTKGLKTVSQKVYELACHVRSATN